MSTATHRQRVSSGERINAHTDPGRLRLALEGRGVRLTRQRRNDRYQRGTAAADRLPQQCGRLWRGAGRRPRLLHDRHRDRRSGRRC